MVINSLEVRIEQLIAQQAAKGFPALGSSTQASPAPCITFKRYMSLCLYDEQEGYYRSGPVRVGRDGDFYTSSGVGTVMAECLAKHLAIYSHGAQEGIVVVEWGAGTGRLSMQLNEVWNRRYGRHSGEIRRILIEDHPAHRTEAQVNMGKQGGKCASRAAFLTSDEAMAEEQLWLEGRTVVLANELLDAFPIHRVAKLNGELVELGVAGTAAEGFYYVYMPLSDARIAEELKLAGISLQEGQITEVNLDAGRWLSALAERMTEGRIIIIDYGHEAKEYTAEHRMQGTFLCYADHTASDDPFTRIGNQDMTAHVPFTLIRQAAEAAGWEVSYYDTQKQFLIDHGVLELLCDHAAADPFSEASRMNRAVRQLLLSDGMSEAFKVLILDKK